MTYPTTIEAFINSVWYKKVTTLVSNYRLNEPVEDTMGDIVLALIEKDYLARWDKDAGSYSNWIYTFAGNLCKKKYKRSHTIGGFAIENAKSIASKNDDDPASRIGKMNEVNEDCDPDLAKFTISSEASVNYQSLVKEMNRILSSYPANSTNEFNGVVYERDMKTILNLLLNDIPAKQIAVMFATSECFVYTLIRKMRTILNPLVTEELF